jgi:hypothetical protein
MQSEAHQVLTEMTSPNEESMVRCETTAGTFTMMFYRVRKNTQFHVNSSLLKPVIHYCVEPN